MSRIETVTSNPLMYDSRDQIVHAKTGEQFDTVRYSRMKYGDRESTRALATDLATTMMEQDSDLVESAVAPELLVAYKAVPPACFYLSRYCLDTINEARLEEGNEPGRVIHVYKDKVVPTNYALATPEERARELQSIGFSLEGRPMEGVPVAVLDDIRITGNAEQTMVRLLEGTQPRSVTLGYVAIFDQQQAAERPSVEMDLNSAVIQNIHDLLPSIRDENFDLNIRTLKLMLGSNTVMLEDFLAQCPPGIVEQVRRGAVSTGPDFIEQYKDGFGIVKQASLIHSQKVA